MIFIYIDKKTTFLFVGALNLSFQSFNAPTNKKTHQQNVKRKVLSRSDHTLCHHGLSHFHKSGDISPLDIIDVSIGLTTIGDTLLVDAVHDAV